MKRLAFVLVLLAILAYAGWNWGLRPWARSLLKARIQEAQGVIPIAINFDDLAVFFIGAQISSGVSVGKLPLTFECSTFSAQVPFTELLLFRSPVYIDGVCHKGKFSAAVQAPLADETPLSFALQDLMLAEPPLLKLLGVQAGTLNINLDNGIVRRGQLEEGDVLITVRGLRKPGSNKLPPILFPLPVAIPPLLDANLTSAVAFLPGALALKKFEFDSNLGKVTAAGMLPGGSRGFIKLEGQIRLTQEGVKQAGPFLQMFSRTQTSHSSYTFTLDGSAVRPKMVLTPLVVN